MINREFAQAKIPTGVQVCEKQLFHHIDRMENVSIDTEIESFLPVIYRKLDWMSKEDIIRRFVSLEFNRFLEYYRDARDLNVEEEKRDYSDRPDSRRKGRDGKHLASDRDNSDNTGRTRGNRGRDKDSREASDRDLTRMFVSIGRKDRVLPQQLIGLINEVTKTREIKIGRIDIMDNYSFIDIDSSSVKKVLKAFDNTSRNPDGVRIEVASERDGESKAKSSWPFKQDKGDSPKRSSRESSDSPERKKKKSNNQPFFESPWNRPQKEDKPKRNKRK
jgi:ATP-dependent RNA helicase DeaD